MFSKQDGADKASSNSGLRWPHGLWGLLLGLVATVGGGHIIIMLLLNWLGDDVPSRDFSFSRFALVWLLLAMGVSLVECWNQRNLWRQKRSLAPARGDTVPRWLKIASSGPSVFYLATILSAYIAAIEGEIQLVWMDAIAAFAFVVAAFARRSIDRCKTIWSEGGRLD